MTEGRELNKWLTHIDWWSMLPPGRPPQTQLQFIRSHLRGAENVLILGSTPEYRDLCVEERVGSVHVIDYSESFHRHVSAQRVYTDATEAVTFARWQDYLPTLKSRFDVILGDLVSGNVDYPARADFYSSIAKALRRNGRFIERVLTNREGYQRLKHLDQYYRRAPLNLLTVNNFANEYFFTSEIVEQGGIVDVREIVAILSDRYRHDRRLQAVLAMTAQVVPADGVWFYGRPWETVERHYGGLFSIEGTHMDSKRDRFMRRIETFIFSPRRTRW
ncbi:class I SAM-dependent methyltransferase [Promicromonospora sp. NPDC023805]|uniref:class I SAM-dependent methyltransferase n=1 Tax=Promicromonospora sp. NPDC023805 TaxID=3154696 RepID=UPI0034023F22